MTRSGILSLLLIVSSTVGTLLMGEVGLQLFYRAQKGEWLWENSAFRIGYTQSVDDRRQYSLRPKYADAQVGLSIDSDGFRQTLPNKTAEQLLVVCLGDSVPFGAGVRDEETYPSYLAAKLHSSGMPIGVLNAGVPSYSLRQSLDRLRIDVLAHHPSDRVLLITVEAANDISLLTYYGSNWNPDLTWAPLRWSGSWGQPLFKKLATPYYLSRFLDLSRYSERDSSPQVQAASNYEVKRREMFESLRKVLLAEMAFLQELSIPVILVPINPFYYQLSGQEKNEGLRNWNEWRQFVKDWDQLIGEYNDMLLRVSKDFPNVYFFDMRPIMDSLDRNLLYLDFMHYTPEGNRLVADNLFEFLIDHKLVQGQASTAAYSRIPVRHIRSWVSKFLAS